MACLVIRAKRLDATLGGLQLEVLLACISLRLVLSQLISGRESALEALLCASEDGTVKVRSCAVAPSA